MPEIITIGEIIVEMMAKEVGQTFDLKGEWIGPFPSGAPAIFINQSAQIGSSSGIIGVVGDDEFGKLNIEKLKASGVQVDMIFEDKDSTTGVAFVSYKEDGSRNFIFHLKDSAAGKLDEMHIKEEYFERCKILHIMGSALFNNAIQKAVIKAIEIAKRKKMLISFDPNIRKELMKDPKIKEILSFVYEACDIFLPSEGELSLFDDSKSQEEIIKKILQTKKYLVLKNGSSGCTGYSSSEKIICSGIQVKEVDPTGAGDTFSGTFISCLNKGYTFRQAVEYANIAGANAVTQKGPMEGNCSLEELRHKYNIEHI